MSSETINILLIENSPTDAHLISVLLAGEDPHQRFALVQVDDLGEGIRRFWEEHYDLVLLDLSLPGMRGLDALVRARRELPAVPIVVLTESDDEATGVAAVQAGAQDYLIKGHISKHTLMRAMRYAIERHRLLRSLSMTDELTGLHNRRGLLTLGEQHLRLAERTKRSFLLIYLDMDGLKYINDTFGHGAGSQAICEVAQILRQTFRTSDIVARLGGDEFAVIAAEAADNTSCIITARLQSNFEAFNRARATAYELSLSIGVARFQPDCQQTLEDLLHRADEAMYENKRQKKGLLKTAHMLQELAL